MSSSSYLQHARLSILCYNLLVLLCISPVLPFASAAGEQYARECPDYGRQHGRTRGTYGRARGQGRRDSALMVQNTTTECTLYYSGVPRRAVTALQNVNIILAEFLSVPLEPALCVDSML